MSLKINGKRLLSEALADAMDRDVADVPAKEELEKQHRFSKKFVRRIKQIEKGIGDEDGVKAGAAGKAEREAETEKKDGVNKEQRRGFASRGKRALRYGGMAAALVCVIGLAAFLSVMGRMGASKKNFSEGSPQLEGTEEKGEQNGIDSGNGVYEEVAGTVTDDEEAPADDAAEALADELEAMTKEDAPAGAEENTDFVGESMAPGWQEQLLAESERADALISWHLTAVYDGMSFALSSEVAGSGETGAPPASLVSASRIYEVYCRESAGEWVRVYHTDRAMSRCEPDTAWEDEYFMQELNMTKPGTYRVVRQVNSYRQVLELTLDRMD